MADNLANDDSPARGTTNGGITTPGTETRVSSTNVNGTGKNPAGNTAKLQRDNKLSKMSSYTYNISLYIVTPSKLNEYYAAYDEGGSFSFSQDGFYIVAQSGGIGANENRAITLDGSLGANPGYDYYIDDLSIKTVMPTKDGTKTATSDMEFTFKIVEPIGFNFLFQLRSAADRISLTENIPPDAIPNQYQHKYMIGIRFYGYDVAGSIQTASEIAFNDTQSGLTNPYAVYERFFPIDLTSFSFKLDGRATVYSITATAGVLQTAYGMARGIVKSNTNISGTTVGEILSKSLVESLNNNQQAKLVAEDRDQYVIEFEKNSRIASAKLINPNAAGNVNSASPTSPVKTTNQSTVAVANRSQTMNVNSVTTTINASKSIVQIIDNIITNSEFISKTLSETATSQIEAEAADNGSTATTKFNWYTVIPKAEILKRSSNTKDWVYKITYFIKEFSIPYIRSPYVNKTTEFYGAVKRYEYWYTGKSSEIKSLDFTYNNLYYNIVPVIADEDKSAFDGRQGNTVRVAYQNASDADIGGTTIDNKGSTYNQNVNASIYNQVDNNEFKISILGDPDFLMTTVATPLTNTQAFSKMYGPGFVVNPMDGSVFVEIDFMGAYDYENDGLLQLTNAVNFYTEKNRGQLKAAGINGLIMEVTHCTSTFNRGTFLQLLEGILLDETVLLQKLGITSTTDAASQRTEQATTTGAAASTKLPSTGAPTAAAIITNQAQRNNILSPVSSLALGTQKLLADKPTSITNPSVTDVQNSAVYQQLRRNGVGAREAYAAARLSLDPKSGSPVVNDDASTQSNSAYDARINRNAREPLTLIDRGRKLLGIPSGGTNPRQ